KGGNLHRVLPNAEQVGRRLHQHGANPPSPATRKIAPPEGSGDKDDPAYLRLVPEDKCLSKDSPAFRGKLHLTRRLACKGEPDLLIGRIGDEQPANAASHAVPDDDHLLPQWEPLSNSGELAPEDRGGIGIRIATGITVEPELVVVSDSIVPPQRV